MDNTETIFSNKRILSWLGYFSEQANLNFEKVKIMDISKKNKNVIPTIESNKCVMILSDGEHGNFFYDLWSNFINCNFSAGNSKCFGVHWSIYYKEGSDPDGDCEVTKVRNCINTELNKPAAMVILNHDAKSTYKIGLSKDNFSNGPIRYVGSEIRAVIMSMLHIDASDVICIISGESISVEAAMIANEGTIISVEYRAGDRETMEDNTVRFGLNNVEIVKDCEVATLKSLPQPSLAFIVADKNLEEEIANLLIINPKMEFVIYTLELNLLNQVPILFKKYGIEDMEITQISISKLNNKNVFETQPVPWLIKGVAR